MILFPNAKINIGLNILKKRPDGFHEIDTLMYPISLTDIINIQKDGCHSKGSIKLENHGLRVGGDPKDNIIAKAYELLAADFDLPSVLIKLQKNIPFGAGLGGGSADGTLTLIGLNAFFKLNISNRELEKYAAKLGSDTAFFVENKPAFSRGRGEVISPAKIDLSDYQIVVVVPPVHVSTKDAYSNVKPQIPEFDLETIINKQAINNWKNILINDFENSVIKLYPEIGAVKTKLYNLGAVYASMSGSGSAVFGIFDKPVDLDKKFPANYFVWCK